MAGERFDEIKRWCDDFCEQYGTEGENGPAHVVVSDYNFDDKSIESCMNEILWRTGGGSVTWAVPVEDAPHLDAAFELLRKIRAVRESERLPPDHEYVDG